MLKKIFESIKRLSRQPCMVDPSSFGDPVAERTKWTPAKGGGASFCTRKLVETALHRIEFRASLRARLFYLVFLFVGLGIIVGFSYDLISREEITLTVDTVFPYLIGIVFAVVGGCLFYFGTRPIVFDKHSEYFWKGRKGPSLRLFNKAGSMKNCVKLEQIHALQIISEHCHSKNKSYYSYELNLVLKDGERINVIDHGDLEQIQEDARKLSEFLGRPLWDAA